MATVVNAQSYQKLEIIANNKLIEQAVLRKLAKLPNSTLTAMSANNLYIYLNVLAATGLG